MTDMAMSDRSKAIFIDGPGAYSLRAALKIQDYDLPALYRLLKDKVGHALSLWPTPTMSMDPGKITNPRAYKKLCAGAGFEAVPDGEDDDTLKTLINRFDSRRVGEIVIFTSDKDFIPALLAKASEGIAVYWVSTLQHDPYRHRHSLSNDVIQLAIDKKIVLVELGPFARMIGVRREQLAPNLGLGFGNDGVSEFKLCLTSNDPHKHLELNNEIQRLVTQFGGALKSKCVL